MQLREVPAQPLPENAEQGHGGSFKHCHLASGGSSGGGDLQPDPARSDDHQSAAGGQRGAERLGLTDAAQRVDLGQVDAGSVGMRGVAPVASTSCE